MLAKYKVDYAIKFDKHTEQHHYISNDPVACEQFLVELLEHGFKIEGITHEGMPLPPHESDKMIRTAAGILAARRICASLGIDSVEAHRRFGSPA